MCDRLDKTIPFSISQSVAFQQLKTSNIRPSVHFIRNACSLMRLHDQPIRRQRGTDIMAKVPVNVHVRDVDIFAPNHRVPSPRRHEASFDRPPFQTEQEQVRHDSSYSLRRREPLRLLSDSVKTSYNLKNKINK